MGTDQRQEGLREVKAGGDGVGPRESSGLVEKLH